MQEEGYASVPITNVVNGKSTRGSSQNAGVADGLNIAARFVIIFSWSTDETMLTAYHQECQRESWSMHRHWCHLENVYLSRRSNA